MRTFISVDPDIQAAETLHTIQDSLKKKLKESMPGNFRLLRWEDPGKFHITLSFIGETEKNLAEQIGQLLLRICKEYAGTEINLVSGNISAFPNMRYPRVIVLEMIDSTGKLNEISSYLRSSLHTLGISADDKPFRPHVTLARVRRDSKLSLTGVDLSLNMKVTFKVNGLCFYESKLKPSGSEYSIIKEYSFS